MPTQEELNGGFNLGDWEVLPSQRVLRRNGEVITPEPMVFDVLIALAKRDGDLVTKDELIDEVWKGKAFSDEPIQQKSRSVKPKQTPSGNRRNGIFQYFNNIVVK